MTTHNKLTNEDLRKTTSTDRKNVNRSLIVGSVVATLIAITPYIFYSYNSVPDEKIWDTIFFTFKSNFYESANMFAWVFMGKFLPLYLLLIWFFTCRHWWYHVLLIPTAMFVFQLFGTINDDVALFDEYQIIYLIPLMAIIIPSIYLIRAKMFNRITSHVIQDLEDEYRIGPKSIWDKVKEFF